MRVLESAVAIAFWLAVAAACGPKVAVAGEVGADEHYLFFSGADLWRNGGFVHGGVLWSPDGLEKDGFTLKALTSGGVYRYRSGGTEITGKTGLFSLMPGWRAKWDGVEVTAMAGIDLQDHVLAPDDPANRMRGFHAGIRGGFDLWYQPSEQMMIAASVSASTIGPNYWSRLATGWRLYDLFWVGPEALALGGSNYQQYRLGFHATAFRTGPLEWSAGLGYQRDSDRRNGLYGRIGLLKRQ